MKKEDIIRIAAEVAVRTTLDTWDKQYHDQRRNLINTRLWNTRTLLKHYHSLKKYCENALYAKSSENPVQILESLGNCKKEQYIESIKSSVERTKAIMSHVDTMLRVYQIYCATSDKPEDQRKYRVLQATYFDKLKIDDICQSENIDRSTYYRDNRETNEMLSALIFGVDGLLAMRQR